MMKRKGTRHSIDGLLALLLFGVFAVCLLAVLLSGAGAYGRLTERDRAAYDRRTGVQYVATRVRQADSLGGVSVDSFGGVQALCLPEDSGYVTYVYCYEGYLMELYTAQGQDMAPEDGERILEAENLALSLEQGLLSITVTDSHGQENNLRLSLRSGEGAAA